TRAARLMSGCVAEAAGQIPAAVAAYRSVGTDAPTRAFGAEWLRVAQDDAAHGDRAGAWRAALMSKFHQPDEPQGYHWLAAELAQEGLAAESRTELELVDALGR